MMPQAFDAMALDAAVERVWRDGFVVVEGYLDKDLVERARTEILALYETASETAERGLRRRVGAARAFQLLIDLPGHSPSLDALFERLLGSSWSRDLLSRVAGPNCRLRDVNCRLMTGVHDAGNSFNPPHEWHRDSPGEVGIGLFLTEVPGPGNGATALVRGSHMFPADPRYDALLGRPFYSRRPSGRGIQSLARLNPFGRKLARKVLPAATGAYGRPGDFYVFINDVWHGREANLHGQQSMVVLAGGFAVGFAHREGWRPPSPEILARILPAFRAKLTGDGAERRDGTEDCLIRSMLEKRPLARFGDPFWLARVERRFMNAVSLPLELPRRLLLTLPRELLHRISSRPAARSTLERLARAFGIRGWPRR